MPSVNRVLTSLHWRRVTSSFKSRRSTFIFSSNSLPESDTTCVLSSPATSSFSGIAGVQQVYAFLHGMVSHHEFGLGHCPYQFDGTEPSRHSSNDLNYWMPLWCNTYAWLERTKPKTALFICYEELCESEKYWDRLAALASIAVDAKTEDQFRLSNQTMNIDVDQRLADNAAAIYARLVTKSHSQLSGVG